MTARSFLPLALLAGLAAAGAQNNLFNTSTTAPIAPKAGPGPQPIEVLSSGAMSIDINDGVATYKKNVRVNDPQFFLRCESLRLLIDLKSTKNTNQPPATPTPPGTNAPPLTAPMGGRIREAEALGGVVFSNKVDFTQAFADRLVYQVTNDAFELTGDVRVIRGEFTSRAPKFLYYRARGVFEADGESSTTFTPASTNAPPKTNAPSKKL